MDGPPLDSAQRVVARPLVHLVQPKAGSSAWSDVEPLERHLFHFEPTLSLLLRLQMNLQGLAFLPAVTMFVVSEVRQKAGLTIISVVCAHIVFGLC